MCMELGIYLMWRMTRTVKNIEKNGFINQLVFD